ncbi:Zinc knuckle CX2CX4HX4C [Parasponia andersonii]|uniref:Zinc knuckle CX2CX4HX4C n=1 Tax=Parasponia andersonii TaxID=3476 RepID=A0A2P5AJY6_PARAD|nr:Zinc knuckle CX2CX4HX4C [Parasponia andersonii]
MTLKGDLGHFARIHIDIDLSQPILDSLMFEVGEDCLLIPLSYENLLAFCLSCNTIGHAAAACKCGVKASTETKDKYFLKERNVFSVLRKDFAAKRKVDEFKDGMENKNLWAEKVLIPIMLIRLLLVKRKIEDLDPKLIFGKKDGDDINVNVAIDHISKKDGNASIQDVSNDSSTIGATSRKARSLTLMIPPQDPIFLVLVFGIWSSLVSGCPTSRLLKKIKLLRTSLYTWNYEVFGDLSSRVNRATNRVTEIQNRMQANSFSEEVFREEADALAALDNALTLKDSLKREKCRIKWLKGGDRNPSFIM